MVFLEDHSASGKGGANAANVQFGYKRGFGISFQVSEVKDTLSKTLLLTAQNLMAMMTTVFGWWLSGRRNVSRGWEMG